MTRVCKKCGKRKELNSANFYVSKGYHAHMCSKCSLLSYKESARSWFVKNKERVAQTNKKYREDNKEWIKERARRYHITIRMKVFQAYSKGVIKCKCCGEENLRFLTLDHTNNNGAEHRRTVCPGLKRGATTQKMMMWLIKNNYPKGHQVLCFNCNCGRANNHGICPHKDKKWNVGPNWGELSK